MSRYIKTLGDILNDPGANDLVRKLRMLGPAPKRLIVHTHVIAADYRHGGAKRSEIADALAAYTRALSHPELAEELLSQWPVFASFIYARSGPGDPLPRDGARVLVGGVL